MTLWETILKTAVPPDYKDDNYGKAIEQTQPTYMSVTIDPDMYVVEERDTLESSIQANLICAIEELGWSYHDAPDHTAKNEVYQLTKRSTGEVIVTGYPIARDPKEFEAINQMAANPHPYHDRVFVIVPMRNGWLTAYRQMDELDMIGGATGETLAEAIIKGMKNQPPR